jgi:hypothetical protein
MAMGLGTFMAKVAAVKNKKEVTSAELNKTDIFISTPLLEGSMFNLIKLVLIRCRVTI